MPGGRLWPRRRWMWCSSGTDLSLSLGHPGDFRHPEVQAAFDEITSVVLKSDKALGALGAVPRLRWSGVHGARDTLCRCWRRLWARGAGVFEGGSGKGRGLAGNRQVARYSPPPSDNSNPIGWQVLQNEAGGVWFRGEYRSPVLQIEANFPAATGRVQIEANRGAWSTTIRTQFRTIPIGGRWALSKRSAPVRARKTRDAQIYSVEKDRSEMPVRSSPGTARGFVPWIQE